MRVQLRQNRRAKGISVPEMAERLNISESFYYKIEQGRRNPRMEVAKRIADILGGTVEELFFAQDLDDMSSEESCLKAAGDN